MTAVIEDTEYGVLGRRLGKIPASEIREGMFTRWTGYRQVTSVRALTVTSGRGSKRATRVVGIGLGRCDGTEDVVEPDALLEVFSHAR